jgi:hypothetical protein
MRFMIVCREATALLLQQQDRRLRWWERGSLLGHLLMCIACRRFQGQVRLMQRATAEWRHYRNEDDGP